MKVTHTRQRREKMVDGRRKREKIYGQHTEIYPQETNKIRGKRSLIEEREEVRQIRGED